MKQQKNNISMKNLIIIVSLLITSFGYSQLEDWDVYIRNFCDTSVYPNVKISDLPYADSMRTSKFYDVETYRELIFRYINEERRINGLPPLVKDEKLMSFAQKHSDWMAKTKKYQHSGENIKEVITHSGGGGGLVSPLRLSACSVVRGWMLSPGHRKHLLNPDITKIGVGVKASMTKDSVITNTYFTAVFKR